MDTRPTFADLGLPTPLVDELTSQGLIEPFPIQQATIADALAGRDTLGRGVDECRLFMVFDGRWKYIHAQGFRPMLYDLETDPNEFHDRGADPACTAERARLKDALFDWALRDHNRITMPNARIAAYNRATQLKAGILIGYWDEAELEQARRDAGLG